MLFEPGIVELLEIINKQHSPEMLTPAEILETPRCLIVVFATVCVAFPIDC